MSNLIQNMRTAVADDLDALLMLQRASLRALTAPDYPAGQVEKFLSEMDMITPELLAEGHFFVGNDPTGRFIVCGGWSQAVPGYAHGFESQEDSAASDEAIVRSMFVAPDFARQGLGRRMMNHIETDARVHGIRRLTLSATRTGLPLYRACGFGNERWVDLVLSDGTRIAGVDMDKDISSARIANPPVQVAGAAA